MIGDRSSGRVLVAFPALSKLCMNYDRGAYIAVFMANALLLERLAPRI